MIDKVRKAVFPAAGLGTRFLPATKAQPKEMLSLVDKPLIQYGVEEAMHSGVQNIIIVTGRGKTAIEDHFDVSFELEHLLETRHKKDLLATVRSVSDMINVAYVRQKEALGLGHAVLRAREMVGDEPFAVILSDDVIDAEQIDLGLPTLGFGRGRPWFGLAAGVEKFPRALDGEALFVKQTLDFKHQLHVFAAVEPVPGAGLLGPQRGEFGLPESQYVGFDPGQTGDVPNPEIKLVRNFLHGPRRRVGVRTHGVTLS